MILKCCKTVMFLLLIKRQLSSDAAAKKNEILSFVPGRLAFVNKNFGSLRLLPHFARGGGLGESHDKDVAGSRISTPEEDSVLSPCCDLPEDWDHHQRKIKRGLILMDVFSIYHLGYLSNMAREAYGVGVAYVLSDYMTDYFQIRKHELDETSPVEEVERVNVELMKQLPPLNKTEEWMEQLPFDQVVGIICETDSGLAAAERWGERFNVTYHNGVNEARRDKFLMNNVVGQKGLDVVQQELCRTKEDAISFVNRLVKDVADSNVTGELNHRDKIGQLGISAPTAITGKPVPPPLCVIKPARGVASDNVFLCRNIREMERAFDTIHGSTIFGSPRDRHNSVLVQEFASGTEYAVDTVSKNGHHKIGALWQYDKRPANGAHFVYHATELVDADTEVGRAIYEYIGKALDALGIQWGMTHSEVIVDSMGKPRLVEVNCRQHNTDFAPLTMFCLGYNVLDMLLSAYLETDNDDSDDVAITDEAGPVPIRLKWSSLPDLASPQLHGAIVHLVNHVDGTLIGLNEQALDEIERMESVAVLEIYPHFTDLGHRVVPTVDIRTDAGWIHIVNEDPTAFRRDYERIVELMPRLFSVSESNTLGNLEL